MNISKNPVVKGQKGKERGRGKTRNAAVKKQKRQHQFKPCPEIFATGSNFEIASSHRIDDFQQVVTEIAVNGFDKVSVSASKLLD